MLLSSSSFQLPAEAGLADDRQTGDRDVSRDTLALGNTGADIPHSVNLRIGEGLEIMWESGAARCRIVWVVEEDHLIEDDVLGIAVSAQRSTLAPGTVLVVAREIATTVSTPSVQLERLA